MHLYRSYKSMPTYCPFFRLEGSRPLLVWLRSTCCRWLSTLGIHSLGGLDQNETSINWFQYIQSTRALIIRTCKEFPWFCDIRSQYGSAGL
jgi:hypothetical protein